MPTDAELLARYTADHSEAAFAELFSRYVDLVHSACARQLRDPNDAEDAAQAVFIVLARKAATIRDPHALAPWLLTIARFAAQDLRTRKQAARAREQAAAQLRPELAAADPLAPDHAATLSATLDDALALLPPNDKTLLILRYFEGRSSQETASLLGISQNAAALRTSRALRRLRRALARRGAAIPAAALPPFLLAHALHPASAVLRTNAALSASATDILPQIPYQIAKGVLMSLFKTQLARAARLAGAALILVASGTWIARHTLAQTAPATNTGDSPAPNESLLIKSVLSENNKPISNPFVITSVGQKAQIVLGEANPGHQLSISFRPGEADGDYRPVTIEAKNTLPPASWSLTTTTYFHNNDPVTFQISTGKDTPTQTLTITLRTVPTPSRE